MSVRAKSRPPANGTRRRPRGDRAADQMALNGTLIRRDNSDERYKRILGRLVPGEGPRGEGGGSYGLALEELEEMPFEERREILRAATLLWCHEELLVALVRIRVAPGLSSPEIARVLPGVAKRIEVVEGKRHRGRPSTATEREAKPC